jgi:hypothetical protein
MQSLVNHCPLNQRPAAAEPGLCGLNEVDLWVSRQLRKMSAKYDGAAAATSAAAIIKLWWFFAASAS